MLDDIVKALTIVWLFMQIILKLDELNKRK